MIICIVALPASPGEKKSREGWLQEGRAISYQSITSLFITSEQQNLSQAKKPRC
jgi:hypothetical protein